MNYLHKMKSWRLNHPRGDPLKCACMQWGASGEIRRSWGPSRTRRCPHGPWSSGRGPWCRALSSRSRCSSWGSPRWSPPAASAAPLPGRCLAALPGPHRCWKKGRTCSFRESPLESDTVLLLKAQNEKKRKKKVQHSSWNAISQHLLDSRHQNTANRKRYSTIQDSMACIKRHV